MRAVLDPKGHDMENSTTLLGTAKTRQATFTPLELRKRMRGVFTICWEMSGSGAQIFMIPKSTVHIEFFAEEAGQMSREAALLPTVAEGTRHLRLMTSAFGSQGRLLKPLFGI